jgi:diguanylate cyclase (GGDEF)-like protein
MAVRAVLRRIRVSSLSPAANLLGRLRYAQKFALVGLILLVPLGSVAGAYIDLQRDQIAFSSKERTGVVLMAPLIDLTAELVRTRGEAPADGRVTANLTSAVRHIDTLDERVGNELGTHAAWQGVRRAVLTADQAGSGTADQRRTASTAAISSLLALIVQVGDASNLTLDPDIDSYYLMDTLQVRLPMLLDVAGRSADTAAAGAARSGSDAAMGLGLNHGVITDIKNALDRASNAVTTNTTDARVGAAARDWFSRLDRATDTLDQALTAATKSTDLTGVAAPAIAVQQEARAIAQWAATTLDTLLHTRISGFKSRAWRVGLGSSAAALLAMYLFTGFYLSVTRPIRRIIGILSDVADGDLSKRVPVDTRDEMGFVSTALNDTIARTEMATDRLARRATHDSLTGLPNRSYLLSRLTEALDHCSDSGAMMCVIFVDLDRFKIINDSLGHEAGDQVLCEIASRISMVKGGRDTVARLAGDEFVMMCEDVESVDAGVRLAERIVDAVSEPVVVLLQAGRREVSVGASVGIAVTAGPDRSEPEDLLRDADVAMYHAKQRGRGRVEVFDDTLRIAVQRKMDRRESLRRASARARSTCITSRSSPRPRAGSSVSRRSPAGTIRPRGCWTPWTSSRWPRKAA